MEKVQLSFEKLISLAIQREEEAYDFYMYAREEAELSSAKKLLEELAHQEEIHKEKLIDAVKGGVCETFECTIEEVENMDLSRFLMETPLTPDSSPQDILIVAIKREEAAREFYKVLSELTGDGNHRVVFETLAKEEQNHKERLERMYDEVFQPDM